MFPSRPTPLRPVRRESHFLAGKKTHLKRSCLAPVLALLGLPFLSAEGVSPALTLQDHPLLFADDSGVASREGLVRTVHPARTRALPVLKADQPWEGDRVYLYGSVYQDVHSGAFRMWYGSRPGLERSGRSDTSSAETTPSLRRNGFDLTLLATSQDGLSWTKPPLELHAFNGSTANNIVFDYHSPSVLRDDAETDPQKRYKMLGYVGHPHHAYHAAYSADGVHWSDYPVNPVLKHGDTITLTRHPRTSEYLAYHKRPAQVRGFGRRVVWLSRSRDFQNWSEPELVFTADEMDDEWVSQSHERTEVYNMSVFAHAAGFIGLPAMFRVMKVTPRDQVGPGQSPVDGPIDIQLATSADGREWHRSWPRVNLIPRGVPGSFDGGTILGVASVPVHTEKETWVYYTAINTGHGGPMPPKTISIGRAEWRRHGFVSLDAGPEGGRLETAPLRLSGRLIVNADTARGQLRLALLEADGRPIAGYGLDESETLAADSVRWAASWRGEPRVPTDRPVRVLIEMSNTQLFSLSSSK